VINSCISLHCFAGYVAASGLAATSMVMQMLSSGDHIVTVNDVYGGIIFAFTQLQDLCFTMLLPILGMLRLLTK
jgi:O-acetylhomoserine/O-acetylserine sulfhydrylase-like pyridoxal-dependent enzyme